MPKRSRPQSEGGEKEDARVSTSDSSEPLPETDVKNVALLEIILSVAQAHQANCEYTEEHMRGLLRKPITTSPVSIDYRKCRPCLSAASDEQKPIVRFTFSWQHVCHVRQLRY